MRTPLPADTKAHDTRCWSGSADSPICRDAAQDDLADCADRAVRVSTHLERENASQQTRHRLNIVGRDVSEVTLKAILARTVEAMLFSSEEDGFLQNGRCLVRCPCLAALASV